MGSVATSSVPTREKVWEISGNFSSSSFSVRSCIAKLASMPMLVVRMNCTVKSPSSNCGTNSAPSRVNTSTASASNTTAVLVKRQRKRSERLSTGA